MKISRVVITGAWRFVPAGTVGTVGTETGTVFPFQYQLGTKSVRFFQFQYQLGTVLRSGTVGTVLERSELFFVSENFEK